MHPLFYLWAFILGFCAFLLTMNYFRNKRERKALEIALRQWKDPLNLQDVKRYYLLWVMSCDTSEQLDHMKAMTESYFFDRFGGKEETGEVLAVIHEIENVIADQRLKIGKSQMWLVTEIPTLSYHLQSV